jgi:hypothetical protein
MSKDAHESGAPQPSGEALVQERAKPDSAAMRELVGGGALYDDRRRNHGRMRPETPSGLIEKFSADIKRPSAAGLPSWKGDTAPGLGSPPSSDDPTDVETARPGDVAPITPDVSTPRAAMPSAPENEGPSSARMSKEARDALAKEIALGVRGGKSAVPYKSRRERAEEEAKKPAEGSPNVIVKAESPRPPAAKPAAAALRASREAETVARAPNDDQAPPTHPEKRLERKIGAAALAIATLLVGIFVGRYVMQPSPATTATTSPSMSQLVSAFPAALSAVSVSPQVSAAAPSVSAVPAPAVPSQVRQLETVHAVPAEKPAPSAKPAGKASGAHAVPSAPATETKPPTPPTPSAPAPATTPTSSKMRPF